jgi:hypothetical protein
VKDSKKTKKKTSERGKVVTDWQPLFAAIKDVIDWALDIAVKLASRHCPEDIEAIEKVRTCFHAWLDGKPSEMEVDDLLLTIATILAQIDIDLGIDGVDLLAPLKALLDGPVHLPRTLYFPGVARDELPTVVIRVPRRRNAEGGALFTQLAA